MPYQGQNSNAGYQAPTANVSYLQGLFRNVDTDRSGTINAQELQSALSNGTWKAFNPDTVRMMIGMFDRQGTGTLNFDEFACLWNYISEWQNCFQALDRDRSGSIDRREFGEALSRFGYRLSQPTVDALLMKYDRDRKGSMNFDDFILCCVNLHTVTDAFRRQDTDRDGWIQISYEDFVRTVINLTM